MNSRSAFTLGLGFSILIGLIAILGVGAVRRARSIYLETESAQDVYLQREAFRRGIATDLYFADILARDYVLDPSVENYSRHGEQLLAIRTSLQQRMDQLLENVSADNSPEVRRLQEEVESYWESLDALFAWDARNKPVESWAVVTRNVLSRRDSVVKLAREAADINNEYLEAERTKIRASERELQRFLLQMTGFALVLGTVVALLTSRRVAALERAHEAQRKQIEETQDNLRLLSRSLVQAQEVERTALSRELHDEVGQTMTALGIELGNLDALRNGNPEAFKTRLDDVRRLNTQAMRAVRDLAMGLRPSMLDDLGLAAALEWQGREFSRHTGVHASVDVDGAFDDLTDPQRTCIYRVVQEALTNCARHANARNVLVSVRAEGARISVVVQDDGVGFQAEAKSHGGLGLLGIQERVQALDGEVLIKSGPSQGTRIVVEIPIGAPA